MSVTEWLNALSVKHLGQSPAPCTCAVVCSKAQREAGEDFKPGRCRIWFVFNRSLAAAWATGPQEDKELEVIPEVICTNRGPSDSFWEGERGQCLKSCHGERQKNGCPSSVPSGRGG